MAFQTGDKTGLPTNIDLDDTTWTTKYLDGNKAWESRVSKTTGGDPNGAVVGDFYGQPCWSTARGIVYECVKPGPATGDTAAIWVPRDYVAVGTISFFWRPSVPSGWLPFSGSTYLKSNYPILYNLLPDGVTKTPTSFTLPNVRGDLMMFRFPLGTEPSYPLIGQYNPNVNLEITTGSGSGAVMNIIMGIKF